MTAIFARVGEGRGTRYIARCLHKDPEDSPRHEEMGFFEGWGI